MPCSLCTWQRLWQWLVSDDPAWPPARLLACREEEGRRSDYQVLDLPQCLWSLEEDVDGEGGRCKLLMLTLARPEATEEEVTWKKGRWAGGWMAGHAQPTWAGR